MTQGRDVPESAHIFQSELASAIETQTEIFTYMTHPVHKMYPIYVYESMAYVCHMVRD